MIAPIHLTYCFHCSSPFIYDLITNSFHLILPSHFSFHLLLPFHFSSPLHFHRRSHFNCCSHCISFHSLISSTDNCAHLSIIFQLLHPLTISSHFFFHRFHFSCCVACVFYFLSFRVCSLRPFHLSFPPQIHFCECFHDRFHFCCSFPLQLFLRMHNAFHLLLP